MLTIELLARHEDDNGLTCPVEGHLDTDLLGALALLRRRGSLDEGFSLLDVFGRSTTRRFLSRRTAEQDVRDLRMRSSERIRGRALTEGLYAVVSPCATPLVDLLLGERDDDTDRRQESGATWSWQRLQLADKPAEVGATCAARDDYRAVLLNLEALSVRHDYLTVAGGLLLAALPVVAQRAVTEESMTRLEVLSARHDSSRDVGKELDAVDRARSSAIARAIASRLTAPERFTTWSHPAQLATYLLEKTQEQMEATDERVAHFAAGLTEVLDHMRERRREKVDRWLGLLSPVAAIAVLIGLYTSLASLPGSSAGSTLLSAVPDAITVTAWIVAAGALVGLVIDHVTHRRHRA